MSAIEITRGECLRVQGTWTDEGPFETFDRLGLMLVAENPE